MNGPLGLPGSSQHAALESQFHRGFLPRGWIDGLTLANDTTDATNDISIAPGVCRSTVNIVGGTPSTLARDQMDLEIPATILKQLDVAWGAAHYTDRGGDRSGLRCSSSISDTTWHIYVIGAPLRQTDIIAVDSAVQATVLAELRKVGYTAYRRVGSIIRASSALVAFAQNGDYFLRKTLDLLSVNNPGTSRVTHTLKVPVGVVVEADVYFGITLSGAVNVTVGLVCSIDATDEEATVGRTSVQSTDDSAGGVNISRISARVKTNTSGQIASRLNGSSTDITTNVDLRGWWDSRGRNA